MKLSISNIGWAAEADRQVYELMKEYGLSGLEIAPTRIFPENPYSDLGRARAWSDELKATYGFMVPSMQSIWYGRNEKLFGSDSERDALIEYTKAAIDFAEAVGAHNLVFGCPRNRNMPEGAHEDIAIAFFKELGDYAAEHNTVLAMEANPTIYNTNYVNTTSEAIELIREVDSRGFLLNLDMGTMIHNDESIDILKGNEALINHVHISEPGLKLIEHRELHSRLATLLKAADYDGFISIEVGRQDDIDSISQMMSYVREIING